MSNVTGLLQALGGGTAFVVLQQGIKNFQDNQHRKADERRTDRSLPLAERSMVTGTNDQATATLQRIIDELDEDVKRWQAKALAADAQVLQAQADAARLREQTQIEAVQLREQIRDLHVTIGQMEAESRKRPPSRRNQP